MFLKKINKKNKNPDKEYTYYRLVHSYKIGNKIRHQTITSLDSLSGIPKENHKALAERVEEIITGHPNKLFIDNQRYKDIGNLAREFADKIIKKKLFTTGNNKSKIEKEIHNQYQDVYLDSIEQIDSKDIGGEWLIKQSFEKPGINALLKETGMSGNHVDIAQILLTAKLLSLE